MKQPFHVSIQRHVTDTDEFLCVCFWWETNLRHTAHFSPRELGCPEMTRAIGDWLKHNERLTSPPV